MPLKNSPGKRSHVSQQCNAKARQPEKWVERHMCPPGGEWGILQLSHAWSHAPGSSPAREGKTFLSAFFSEGARYNLCGEDVSKALKMAAAIMQYPITWGIPIKRIDTHSLQSGGANALALSGYLDTQIQKMGWWKGTTFKEYI
jgi:hypothetical protein